MAEYKTILDSNRQWLKDVLPLPAPFTLQMEVTERCNFKCNYCMHSTRGQKGGVYETEGYQQRNMPWALFAEMANSIMEFPVPLRHIYFSGMGEPLMHPQLPEMVAHLRSVGFGGRITLITNALLLTPNISGKLIEAGISHIRVSIQGVDNEAYKATCGVDEVLERIVENVRYFFKNKNKNQVLYVKIIDAALRNEGDLVVFKDMFNDICDYIFVEHLVSMERQMHKVNFERDESKGSINRLNMEVANRHICPVPFAYLSVAADGVVLPCNVVGLPKRLSIGSLCDNSLFEIWNGDKRDEFLRRHLKYGSDYFVECVGCAERNCLAYQTETIDDHAEEILARMNAQKQG